VDRLPVELDRLTVSARDETGLELDPEALIWERARLLDLGPPPNGQVSRSGITRLLPTADGWMALTLSRPWDFEALAAWMGHEWNGDPWQAATDAAATMTTTEAVEGAQLLGVAAAVCGGDWHDEQARSRGQSPPVRPWLIEETGPPRSRRRQRPLVVDLSSLWAGPLAGRLLAEWGADVIKVEDPGRPDGTRDGAPAFYRQLNAAKQQRSLSLPDAIPLLEDADVVITSARPRVWDQLGVARLPGTWVQITGYGRTGPWRQRVAFGDDAAVAGGLVARGDPPAFVGDAIADPLTGMVAAWAALAGWQAGGGLVVDIAMREVAGWMSRR
jgi:crotonobetainyl-CoA:carnitine CoA-transferase CaiB-like acyl-CoA transferase